MNLLKKGVVVYIIALMLSPALLYIGNHIEADRSIAGTRSDWWLVNATGSGDYTHIQWALDNASAGDLILIEGGTYYENVIIDKPIEIIGASANNTTLIGEDTGPVIEILSSGVNISGLNITREVHGNNPGVRIFNNNISIDNIKCSKHVIGIQIIDANDNTIRDNYIEKCDTGIKTRSSRDNLIQNNTCSYNLKDGISLMDGSFRNGIVGNNITDNIIGINLGESNKNRVTGNRINSNSDYGISIQNSFYISFYNNELNLSGIIIEGNMPEHWTTNHIDASNTLNGRSIIHWKNRTEGRVPSGASQVILANCSGVIVDGLGQDSELWGIQCVYSDSCRISENILCSRSNQGITLFNSNNNLLTKNNCSNGEGDFSVGIRVVNSSTNSVNDNIAQNNYIGIVVDGYENHLINNTIRHNRGAGITIENRGGNNTIIDNEIASHPGYGIHCLGSDDSIYHNTFIDNNPGGSQALDDGGQNAWSSDTMGNYWSDWNAPDGDGDGIRDSPYPIDGIAFAYDLMPLIMPAAEYPPEARAGPDIIIDQHETVRFNGSASIGHPRLTWYTWSFHYDDILTELNGPAPEFTFHTAGTYDVLLTVNDEKGRSGQDMLTVTVADVTPPEADAGPDMDVNQFDEFLLNGSTSTDNTGITTYNWSFNYDGTPTFLHGENVQLAFDVPGAYNVTLNVTDEAGNWDTDILTVTVLDVVPPAADAGPDIEINASEIVQFNGSGSSDNVEIIGFRWTFLHNGTPVELHGPEPSFLFELPGTYNVTLTVEDAAGNSDSDNLTVVVLAGNGNGTDGSTTDGDGTTTGGTGGTDTDWDGWNDTAELMFGSDPSDINSTPLDYDGDGRPNWEDAYPRDPKKWQFEEAGMTQIQKTAILIIAALVLFAIAFAAHSRITDNDKVFGNENRIKVLAHIKENPGTHLNAMKRELKIGMGVLRHHLKVLNKAQMIRSRREGNFKLFYPIVFDPRIKPMTPDQREVLNLVEKKPGISTDEVAETLDKSRSTISYHLGNLKIKELVSAHRKGYKMYWSPKEFTSITG